MSLIWVIFEEAKVLRTCKVKVASIFFSRGIFFLLFLYMGLHTACYRRTCPAYHSYFILDDSVRRQMFSLFGADSLPKEPKEVKKTNNGLIQYVSNNKKSRRQRIIRMKKVYPGVLMPTDSVSGDSLGLDSLLLAQGDLVSSDSLLAVPDTLLAEGQEAQKAAYKYGYNPKDNFKEDQVFYNQQFGHLFVGEEAPVDSVEAEAVEEEVFDEIPGPYVPEADGADEADKEGEEGENR